MKKYFVVLFLLLSFALNNNLYSQALSIGLKGGLNLSTMLEKSEFGEFSEDYEYLPGYNIGLVVSTSASDGVGGESGIYLNTRGFKLDQGDDQNGVIGSFKTLWLEVPFKATTALNAGPLTFFGSAGVSGSLGLTGTMDFDITVQGNTTNTTMDVSWGNDPEEDDMLRFDYGAVVGAGVEFKSIVLEAGYYYGLANLSPDTDNEFVFSNRYFTFTLGYKFGLSPF